jgi:hypothetical protein
MRGLICLVAVALSTCVPGSRGQMAAQEQDKSIIFPDFSAHPPIVFGAQGQLGGEDALGTTPLFQALSPLAGALFLAASLVAFRVGVRRYTSTGS